MDAAYFQAKLDDMAPAIRRAQARTDNTRLPRVEIGLFDLEIDYLVGSIQALRDKEAVIGASRLELQTAVSERAMLLAQREEIRAQIDAINADYEKTIFPSDKKAMLPPDEKLKAHEDFIARLQELGQQLPLLATSIGRLNTVIAAGEYTLHRSQRSYTEFQDVAADGLTRLVNRCLRLGIHAQS